MRTCAYIYNILRDRQMLVAELLLGRNWDAKQADAHSPNASVHVVSVCSTVGNALIHPLRN